MNVQQLIDKLKDQDPDARVMFSDYEHGPLDIDDIRVQRYSDGPNYPTTDVVVLS